jgi:hypothetical protein
MRAVLGFCAVLMAATAAAGGEWSLSNVQLLEPGGVFSSLWDGTVCYTAGVMGPVRYFDGASFYDPYPGSENCYEPANANGVSAWRVAMPTDLNNEIFRWDGDTLLNISSSPQNDGDVDVASNGDVIWCRDYCSLYYYSAATGETAPLGISGKDPQIYVTSDGVVTYAYQDPSSLEILYFDGETTQSLGPGAHYWAMLSLWDGAVAWLAEGVGPDFTDAEIMFWKDGVTTRITNDDEVNGIQDDYPYVWNGMVVWSRYPTGPLSPRLFVWDGAEMHQLTTTTAKYASYHNCQVTFKGDAGLYIADLVQVADTNCDGAVNGYDIDPFVFARTDQAAYEALYPYCSVLSADVNLDGFVNGYDIDPFVEILVGGG